MVTSFKRPALPSRQRGAKRGLVLEAEGRPRAERLRRSHAMLSTVGLDPATFAERFPHNSLAGSVSASAWRARWPLNRNPTHGRAVGALDPLTRAESRICSAICLPALRRPSCCHARFDELLSGPAHRASGRRQADRQPRRAKILDSGSPKSSPTSAPSIAESAAQPPKQLRKKRLPPMQRLRWCVNDRRLPQRVGGEIARSPSSTLAHRRSHAVRFCDCIPAGIALTRKPRWANPCWLSQHPADHSLAPMFGFLLPLPWLGDRAARIAILALTAYALLPILPTPTLDPSIDPSVIEVHARWA